jgi:hypothetical protein
MTGDMSGVCTRQRKLHFVPLRADGPPLSINYIHTWYITSITTYRIFKFQVNIFPNFKDIMVNANIKSSKYIFSIQNNYRKCFKSDCSNTLIRRQDIPAWQKTIKKNFVNSRPKNFKMLENIAYQTGNLKRCSYIQVSTWLHDFTIKSI